MKRNYNSIIFDFDYTLVDSSIGIIECVNYALTELGFPIANEVDIKNTIGWSLAEIFKRLTDSSNASHQEMFKKLFIAHADKIMTPKTVIFDEVPKILSVLKANNYKTAIVSTKLSHRISEILKTNNCFEYFDEIIGGEDVDKMKPNPNGLLLAVKKLKTNPKNCLYIGDSLADAEASQAAQIDFCPILTGITNEEAFEKFKKIQVLLNLNSLLRFLKL